MSRTGKFIIIVSAIWLVVSTVYASYRTSTALQLWTMLLALVFFVACLGSIVLVFTGWRQCRWRSVIPLAACFLAVVSYWELVPVIRQQIFARSLPSYESVIRQMESGQIAVSTNSMRSPLAEKQARLVWAVFARKDINGLLTVEFLTEKGFPVLHSGYLYTASGVIAPGSEADSRWPIKHQERPKWFYISD